ncbi:hypothetical protein RB2150_04308 [Rhodobacterales bacterium HTCC2150]|nr:hypothetical protein RB2150_04308 [Rhodobacterales bacterium HTCC2150] [Rhodobacteraceae bacterium HTCC2150]
MSGPSSKGGSRFLYEPFSNSNAHRVEMVERVAEEKWAALDYRLGLIDANLERLDRRLWLAVLGVVTVVLSEVVQGIMSHSI